MINTEIYQYLVNVQPRILTEMAYKLYKSGYDVKPTNNIIVSKKIENINKIVIKEKSADELVKERLQKEQDEKEKQKIATIVNSVSSLKTSSNKRTAFKEFINKISDNKKFNSDEEEAKFLIQFIKNNKAINKDTLMNMRLKSEQAGDLLKMISEYHAE
jgi:hypothetical protein